METILITGAYGQLGSEIKELVLMNPSEAYHFKFTDLDTLDITDKSQLHDFFNKEKIDFIVNCAGYTAVDKAETEMEKARLINSDAPGFLAEVCKKHKTKLIHISTDYIFDGLSGIPYKEDDKTNPLSAYGCTKLAGEQAIERAGCDFIIIRTSWLYSGFGHNFVKTILRLGKERDELRIVYDQIGAPTYARDLADTILKIVTRSAGDPSCFKPGTYHYANEGACSWYDFAIEILTCADIPCNVFPIETKEYPLPAKRPHYSVFNKAKIKSAFDIEIPYWKNSLKECIGKISKI
ncbi:MAG: dTDP-4-dehydrorhamnose reductase [Bacteroidia bacterium]|nr:dTDP-4-dehydrorhamnose reductase [Bacteroidia bacterium]